MWCCLVMLLFRQGAAPASRQGMMCTGRHIVVLWFGVVVVELHWEMVWCGGVLGCGGCCEARRNTIAGGGEMGREMHAHGPRRCTHCRWQAYYSLKISWPLTEQELMVRWWVRVVGGGGCIIFCLRKRHWGPVLGDGLWRSCSMRMAGVDAVARECTTGSPEPE